MQRSNSQLPGYGNLPGQEVKNRRRKRNIVQWWFDATSVPEPSADADFEVKDKARRSHLVSIIVFLLIIVFFFYIPNTLHFFAQRLIIPGLLNTILLPGVIITTILLNRSQKVLAAGIVLVIVAEFAFTAGFFTITNRTITITTLYYIEAFVIGELLAVSLLPAGVVFIVAAYNAAFIAAAFILLPHAPTLNAEIPQNLVRILTIPIAIQFLVAVITYLWVRGSLRSLARADRAEAISRLERQIGLQLLQTREEKLRLEETIRHIVQSHIDTLNNKVVAPLSLSEDTKILWPLVNVITSLQRRLRDSYRVENELRRLHKAIHDYSEFIYRHGTEGIRYSPRTKTDLDVLLSAIVQSKSASGAIAHSDNANNAKQRLYTSTMQNNDYTLR